MRQRGFAWWLYLVAAGAAVALLWAVVAWIDGRGYERGRLEVRAEWDKANRKAAADELARQAAITAALVEEQGKTETAERLAEDNDRKWKEAQRDSSRKGTVLAVCPPAEEPSAGTGDVGSGLRAPRPSAAAHAGGGAGVRFSWQFVLLYDAAWTGADGKPVFPASAGAQGPADAGAASPYGPGDLLDIHGENARGCSADRREYKALMNKIKAAEAAWGSGHATK